MKKAFSIFRRDVSIAAKDPLALWIFFAPLLCAVVINFITPGINDTSVNLAIHNEVAQSYIDAASDFANVEVFDTEEAVTARVQDRDEVIGVINTDTGIGSDTGTDTGTGTGIDADISTNTTPELTLIAQGNETESSLAFAQLLNALYALDSLDVDTLESRLSFVSFGEETPTLKRILSVVMLLLCTIISAMMIALGLVDEKNDKTIKAANVTPMHQTAYMLSKSVIGILMLCIVSLASVLILGITDINFAQLFLMIFSIGMISIIVAFAIGLASSDFIEAAGSIKVIMLPASVGILVPELLAERWAFTVWWNPFYWAYTGMTEIINKTATWGGILAYTAIILVLCLVCFMLCKKHIRKHLN